MPTNNPEYQKKYIRQHYLNNKQYYKDKAKERKKKVAPFLRAYVARVKLYFGCKDCGYNENSYALQFDHVRGEKISSVSQMVSELKPLSKIKDEIRKCEVRCANCHAIKTHTN